MYENETIKGGAVSEYQSETNMRGESHKDVHKAFESTIVPLSIKESQEETSNPIHPLCWRVLLILGVVAYGSYTILIHLCEVNGRMPFSSASLILVIETSKFLLSVTLYTVEQTQDSSPEKQFVYPTFWEVLPFSVPAVLYAINNNLDVYIQLEMDSISYQVLGNTRILTTALLFRLIIKKPITKVQWVALGMLAVSGVFSSVGNLSSKDNNKLSINSLRITSVGIIMLLVHCLISGFAGVYTEYVLKTYKERSLHFQNALLYVFGIILNGCFFIGQAWNLDEPGYGLHLFHGYSRYTWLVVISQSYCGVLMGAIMKHATNITRLFLISSALLFTTTVSVLVFHVQVNVFISVAIILVLIALFLYNR